MGDDLKNMIKTFSKYDDFDENSPRTVNTQRRKGDALSQQCSMIS